MSYWIQHRLRSIEEAFSPKYCRSVEHTIGLIARQFQEGNKLLICGNGGSAADAQHIAAEFVGRFQLHRRGLPAIALGTNVATLTAWSNDYEYETVFARQVEALGRPGDILWGISTSGKSPNIIRALETARESGLITIGMAGNGGGMLKELSDYPLFVKQYHTPYIQEIHLMTYHRICEQVEAQLFAKAGLEAQVAV
ncbi:D-sedoheptulose 7-phosphate isomerase [Aphanothece sacrum]|uniref:Phosphoheptose isomerase n=1 Tax=Aphanothece sacrum FPU1 TaxID=1920663 RepID=A0A401IJT5_APHSA|nr:D-sedoheptulose 7-phosphate isomerase [Aphanothece sacrum]GBF81575.1 phosphoheptose isomerase [Aphanothece sacrum FPU1]GBF86968.1 phosphoheptose isomerase GmhA [Aphanothece sacrum FPU3]